MSPRRHLAAGIPVILLLLMTLAGCAWISNIIDQPPSAAFKVTPSSGATVGTPITLDASSSSDPQSYTLQYSWALTGPSGSTAALSATDVLLVTFTPDIAGTYTVILQVSAVSSSKKSGQASKSIIVAATTANSYTVTYNDNGSTGGTVPADNNKYQQGATVTVLGNTGNLVKTGCAFAGWNTKADGTGNGYTAGATFTMGSSNMTLYAVWPLAVSSTWVVGFSQEGSESEWRTADSVSIQNSFNDDPSFILIYSDAQQKQENQIKALRSFIARKVNCILFTALVESGYGPVLQEAADANIPVIMIDRDVQASDQHLRLTVMGSDFVKEGEKAGTWLAAYLQAQGIDNGVNPINIVELQGTTGSAPAIQRKTGFANIMNQHSNWQLTASQTANFNSTDGKSVMAAFLQADSTIRVLYAHNDQMALGAIQAIKEAGLRPGIDIIVIGIDAVKGALQAIVAGDMNCSVECSPLLGPQAVQAVTDLRAGKTLPGRIWTIEGIFDQTNAAAALPTRQYSFGTIPVAYPGSR